MELSHLIDLIDQLTPGAQLKYVRGNNMCTFLKVDKDNPHVYAKTPEGKKCSFSSTFLKELAEKIEPNVPYNTSQILNNKGTNRAVIDSIVASTSEIYWVNGTNGAKLTVWIPTKPHEVGKLAEWTEMSSLSKASLANNSVELSTILLDDSNKQHFSEEELIAKLSKMYKDGNDDNSKTANLLLFGIKYGGSVENASQLCKKAGIPLPTPVVDGVKLHKLIKERKYGVSFYDDNMIIKEHVHHKKTNAITQQKLADSPIMQILTAIRTKPFILLAGISGTGKSRIVRKLAQATVTSELQNYKGENFEEDRWNIHNPENFELIQVKPNWHNSMDVVGYLSNIPTPHYEFTPFIMFVAKAWLHPNVPYFLCLDEMNLAPVEEYFAEYLSAIESRGYEGGEYVTDPIIKPFKDFNTKFKDDSINNNKEDVSEDMLSKLIPDYKKGDCNSNVIRLAEHLKNNGLTLPQNLIVVGTVNMDETTFSFSRKVLDRAMSIEMNDVNYDSFFKNTTDDDIENIAELIGTEQLDDMLVNRPIDGHSVIDNIGVDNAKFAIDYLKLINSLFDGTPFKLGYRAANEALLYLSSAKDFGNEDLNSALDNFTMMKILSRIEGDTMKLGLSESENIKQLNEAKVNTAEVKNENHGFNLLTALKNVIINNLGTKKLVEGTSDEIAEGSNLKVVKKLNDMINRLNRDRFVSYWS